MVTFNIPEGGVAEYRGKPVIVRTHDPAVLVSTLRHQDLEFVVRIQVCDLSADLRPLIDWECSGPVEVVLRDPATDFPQLYRLTELLRTCPVRVVIPVVPGFLKALRVAASLHCAVKLEIGQPTPALVCELLEALEFYLHGQGVTQPVEFFHSLLAAGCRGEPVTLWDIQEENPAAVRFVGDDGRVALQGRLAGLPAEGFDVERLAAHPGCAKCPYVRHCAGYFKWPDPGYACDDVKVLLRSIAEAAQALNKDLKEHRGAQEPAKP